MHETSKAVHRRLHGRDYVSRYFVGRGIDVGCGNDSLGRYKSLFPLITEVTDWDVPQGDAQTLPGVAETTYDFLHSSHCLEHLGDPFAALTRWCRVVRNGGHLVILVPDEDLYEQGVFPSTWNPDHKWTFTIYKVRSWSPKSVNVTDLFAHVAPIAVPVRVELLNGTGLPRSSRRDDTLNPVTESAIEFVLRRL